MDDTRELLAILNDLPRHKPLTRVHIHTLAYQAVFTLRDNNKWMSGITTAVKSSLTATRSVTGGSTVLLLFLYSSTSLSLRLSIEFPNSHPLTSLIPGMCVVMKVLTPPR